MNRRSQPTGWISASALMEGRVSTAPDWSREIARWLASTVMRHDAALLRPGALCPFVAPAIVKDLVFMVDGGASTTDMESIVRVLHEQRCLFLGAFSDAQDSEYMHKSLIVAFPGLLPHQWDILCDVRIAVKPSFIASGVTCGEFYPSSEDRSARNQRVRVARSPVPCVVLRYLSPHDELFLRTQPELYRLFLAWRQRAIP